MQNQRNDTNFRKPAIGGKKLKIVLNGLLPSQWLMNQLIY